MCLSAEASFRRARWALAIRLVVFTGLFVSGLFAQTQGQITGLITDSSGAAVSGARVTVTNTGTHQERTTTSTDAGLYAFPSLLPGIYDLKVEKPGFATALGRAIELQVQQSARIDFTLKVGQVAETLNVQATASLLNTENATVGTVIENKRIVDLPLNGRNFLQLVSLAPDVHSNFGSIQAAGGRQGGTRVQQNISVAGQRSEYNHFTLDGVEDTDVNFNTYVLLPSIDALLEFKVQTGIYPAEFGRQVTQINVSTKSGTNAYHATLFEFLRNDKLDARSFAFTSNPPPKQPFKWNQYGFTLAGPVLVPKVFNGKDRLFFMANFEGFRSRAETRGFYNVPSAAMRQGDFSQGALPIFDPRTRTGPAGSITALQFPGNIIPANRIDATSVKLLQYYPAPNVNTSSLVSNYQNTVHQTTDKDQFNTRVDYVESAKSSWFARFGWGDEQDITPALFLNGTNLITHVRQIMLSNTRVLSPTAVNEFRFGYTYMFNSIGTQLAFQKDAMAELGIPGVNLLAPVAWGTPSINFVEFSAFGDNNQSPAVNNNHVFQWTDNFSWIHNKHSLRFGGEIRRDRYNVLGSSFPRGNFNFARVATSYPGRTGTGNSFADFVLGYPQSSQTALKLAQGNFRATSEAFYIDDVWKVTPTLTLNFGLRYEFTPPYYDKSGFLINAYIPVVDTTPNVADLSRHPVIVRMGGGDFYQGIVFRFNPAIQTARDGRLGDRLVRSDYNDFAPRVGIAWHPMQKLTVRTGAGIFYNQDVGNSFFDMTRNAAGRRDSFTNTDFPNQTWEQPFGAGSSGVQVNTPFIPGYDPGRRTPYTITYLFNVQWELTGNTLLEVGYNGSLGRKLPMFRAYNQALPGATGSVVSRTPYPELGYLQYVSGLNQATYNSGTIKLEHRFSRGLTYLSGYTLSKAIDYSSGLRTHSGENGTPQNNYNVRAERGLSLYNAKHRFVSSVIYDLPFGSGKAAANHNRVLNVVAGGWQLGSIVTLQSGFPGTVFNGVNQQNDNIGVSRPNATGQPVALPGDQRGTERWFNSGAYVIPAFGSFGNTARSTVIAPGMVILDGSAVKNFRIREGHELQFRFEAFNLMNHPNWDLPDMSILSNTYTKIRSTRTAMRQVQFGLKYMF